MLHASPAQKCGDIKFVVLFLRFGGCKSSKGGHANVGTQSRRLGTVTGNSTARFMIDWSATVGQPIVMSAIPIGGGGRAAASQPLSVGYGQMIYFTVASVLRQSTASVGDP